MVKKILVSQPQPTSEKSPYYDIEKEYGVKCVFRPFFKVEGLSAKEFRKQRVNILEHSAVVFTSRHAIDHFFTLAKELRITIPEDMKVDSIPVMRAVETGHPKNVVILTRNKGYRSKERDRKIPHFIYKKYPRLRVALSHRVAVYNAQLELVERLEAAGRIVCIRPERPMEVGRMEKDTGKLERLYEEGFTLGNTFCEALS